MTGITHAGGVVFRIGSSGVSYVVVSSRHDPRHWVFPKGHIEEGERVEDTAIREVLEETGIKGEIVDSLGMSAFSAPKEQVRVAWFLMRHVGDAKSTEQRRIRWCSFDEAIHLLSFEDTRDLLRKARDRIRDSG